MFNFYFKSTKGKKFSILFLVVILSIPAGGIIGGFLGLIATTFIPQCCGPSGCHNCFEFNGLVGYEATAYLGFWGGLIIFPLALASAMIYFYLKGKI